MTRLLIAERLFEFKMEDNHWLHIFNNYFNKYHNMRTSFSLLLITLAIPFLSTAQNHISFFNGTLEEAMLKADAESKTVYIDCQTSWCGPCKTMEKQVFTDSKVAEYFNSNFINLSIDMEKGEGPNIGEKYSVKSYPTHLFLDKEGTLLHHSAGMYYSDKFIALGQEALDPDKRNGRFAISFKSGNRSTSFLLEYLDFLENIGSSTSVVLDTLIAHLSKVELESDVMLEVFYLRTNDIRGKAFEIIVANTDKFNEKYGPGPVMARYTKIYQDCSFNAIQKEDWPKVEALIKRSDEVGMRGYTLACLEIPQQLKVKAHQKLITAVDEYLHTYLMKGMSYDEFKNTSAGKNRIKELDKVGDFKIIIQRAGKKERHSYNIVASKILTWANRLIKNKEEIDQANQKALEWLRIAALIRKNKRIEEKIKTLSGEN
jgi:thiol-disulfide isomerase/thioredoxin